jgi:septum site-determining protein MinC
MGHHYVTIKGTKDGLTLHLDDTCSYQDIIEELEDKLSSDQRQHEGSPLIAVRLKAGNRYLSEDQEEELRNLVRSKKNLVVESIDSNVISRQDALNWKKDTEITSVSKIIRSGQVLEVRGDLLLLGDVNPGGTVMAGGNIFVLGALRGIAHAGCSGNEEAVIASSVMKPSQLRIADVVSRAPDTTKVVDGVEMECAYIDLNSKQIVLDRIQMLSHLRPNLTRLERGM